MRRPGPGSLVAAVLSAAAIATPMIADHEGFVLTGYRDIVGVATACAGSTRNVIVGKRYAEQECLERLATETVEHGIKIEQCITRDLPARVRAAFISLAFNVGVGAFCASTMVKLANAGDLAGACAQFDRWIYAGGKVVQGLVNRRKAERAMCESGLVPPPEQPAPA